MTVGIGFPFSPLITVPYTQLSAPLAVVVGEVAVAAVAAGASGSGWRGVHALIARAARTHAVATHLDMLVMIGARPATGKLDAQNMLTPVAGTELLDKSDEKSLGTSDIAQSIRVFVAQHVSDAHECDPTQGIVTVEGNRSAMYDQS